MDARRFELTDLVGRRGCGFGIGCRWTDAMIVAPLPAPGEHTDQVTGRVRMGAESRARHRAG